METAGGPLQEDSNAMDITMIDGNSDVYVWVIRLYVNIAFICIPVSF